MRFAVFRKPVSVIYEKPAFTKQSKKGTVSAIADEGLYGMTCQVLGREDGWAHILMFYGYAGYVREENLFFMTETGLRDYLSRELAVVEAGCADVLSLPAVQGVCQMILPGGALVEMVPGQPEVDGYTKVRLLTDRWQSYPPHTGQEQSGRSYAAGRQSGAAAGESRFDLVGYVRTQHLGKKRFGEDFLWREAEPVAAAQETISVRSREAQGGAAGFSLAAVLERFYNGSEGRFREQLEAEARRYMGVQYRWGGKSPQGIDCSGLVCTAYMKSGVLIYRDASIADGFPIRRISREDALAERLKKGDLLYFPGHIAMYIGEGRYIHSTAHIGSGGVVINSLREGKADERADLRECLYAAGGVR